MLILNTGGTFNKRYNKIKGELEVPFDNLAIENILKTYKRNFSLAGVVYKDSLYMELDDRKMIANIIMNSKETKFIIIHGTDTMTETAEFLSEVFDDRLIVLLGSMVPFEIDKVESSLNLGIALGFVSKNIDVGVYICMNGYLESWEEIVKNKQKGIFELRK